MNVPADDHDHHEPDHWSPRHPLRDARGGHADAQLHGRIFVLGGFTSGFAAALDSVEVRDPNTDTWRPVAPMPTARGNRCVTRRPGQSGQEPSVETLSTRFQQAPRVYLP
jgi:hypothetical protein